MATPRPASRALGTDDRAVAGVVGFVLVLAAAVTYYSYAAQNEVPRMGAENEREWDADVGAALVRLAHTAGDRAGTDTSVREVVPPAPDSPSQSVMFLAPLRSARATGSLSFEPGCASANAAHVVGAVTVGDITSGARGCLTFRGETAYAAPFAYQLELGGILRLQGDDAAVLAGPPFDVSATHIALTLIDMRGDAQTLGVHSADAPVTFSPRPGTLELGNTQNAASVAWTFTTDHPEAWRDWYASRFTAAGVPATTSITCTDPGATGPARGPCDLDITIAQPTSLSISYGRYDIDLG